MIIDLSPKPVLYFDGVCNLCNGAVRFVIRHDKKKRFLFAPLQSSVSMEAMLHTRTNTRDNESVILFYKDKYYTKSDAALHTLRLLGGGWALFYAFILIPRFIRNPIYNFVARNRYKWFGRSEECMIPTEETEKRFIS